MPDAKGKETTEHRHLLTNNQKEDHDRDDRATESGGIVGFLCGGGEHVQKCAAQTI
jgi:hypothetical protein